jgi:hypothetical protein
MMKTNEGGKKGMKNTPTVKRDKKKGGRVSKTGGIGHGARSDCELCHIAQRRNDP